MWMIRLQTQCLACAMQMIADACFGTHFYVIVWTICKARCKQGLARHLRSDKRAATRG